MLDHNSHRFSTPSTVQQLITWSLRTVSMLPPQPVVMASQGISSQVSLLYMQNHVGWHVPILYLDHTNDRVSLQQSRKNKPFGKRIHCPWLFGRRPNHPHLRLLLLRAKDPGEVYVCAKGRSVETERLGSITHGTGAQ
jgi:hypothetical protein